MPDVVFVRTRHVYDSYDVLWRLVELGEFEVQYIDEIDLDRDATFVVTPINGEVEGHLKNLRRAVSRRSTLVWWCLERFDGPGMREHRPAAIIDQARDIGFDRYWTSCRNVRKLDPRLEHVIFGSDSKLVEYDGFVAPRGERYDFTHQSYAWGRRMIAYRNMIALGLREGPSTWGADRAAVLASSRLMVNAHQYEMGVYAPLRFALAAAYSMPILSELIEDPYPLTGLVDMCRIDLMPQAAYQLARSVDSKVRQAAGDLVHQRLCYEHRFANEVRKAAQ